VALQILGVKMNLPVVVCGLQPIPGDFPPTPASSIPMGRKVLMLFKEALELIRFWRNADRLGLDVPWTHWRLHVKSLMRRLCRAKRKDFGEGAEFRPGAYAICCSKISLGKRVVVRPGCMLFADPRPDGGGIVIEDDVMMGSGVHIYVANHRFDNPKLPIIEQGHYPSRSVRLERGCWLGALAVVLPGVTVGRNAVVGAGSVVTGDVPAGAVVAGAPALNTQYRALPR
jgi:acetyltransferase-like isoleucine patch superfamily enzyme